MNNFSKLSSLALPLHRIFFKHSEKYQRKDDKEIFITMFIEDSVNINSGVSSVSKPVTSASSFLDNN